MANVKIDVVLSRSHLAAFETELSRLEARGRALNLQMRQWQNSVGALAAVVPTRAASRAPSGMAPTPVAVVHNAAPPPELGRIRSTRGAQAAVAGAAAAAVASAPATHGAAAPIPAPLPDPIRPLPERELAGAAAARARAAPFERARNLIAANIAAEYGLDPAFVRETMRVDAREISRTADSLARLDQFRAGDGPPTMSRRAGRAVARLQGAVGFLTADMAAVAAGAQGFRRGANLAGVRFGALGRVGSWAFIAAAIGEAQRVRQDMFDEGTYDPGTVIKRSVQQVGARGLEGAARAAAAVVRFGVDIGGLTGAKEGAREAHNQMDRVLFKWFGQAEAIQKFSDARAAWFARRMDVHSETRRLLPALALKAARIGFAFDPDGATGSVNAIASELRGRLLDRSLREFDRHNPEPRRQDFFGDKD